MLWETAEELRLLSISSGIPRSYILMLLAHWATNKPDPQILKILKHTFKYQKIYRPQTKQVLIELHASTRSKFNSLSTLAGFKNTKTAGIVIDAVWARWKANYPELSY